MKKLLSILLFSAGCFAQTVTIPKNSMTFTFVMNGTNVFVNGPNAAITLPVTLPGVTISGTTWKFASSVSAPSATLTGSTLPSCASKLYLWQLLSSGLLEPTCYVPPAAAAANAIKRSAK